MSLKARTGKTARASNLKRMWEGQVKDQYSNMGIGMAIGVGVGMAFGAALDDMPLGIGIGIAVGAGLGAVFGTRRNK